MATTYYSAQIRAGLSRIKSEVEQSSWVHVEHSNCLEEMTRCLNDCMSVFERRIEELERAGSAEGDVARSETC